MPDLTEFLTSAQNELTPDPDEKEPFETLMRAFFNGDEADYTTGGEDDDPDRAWKWGVERTVKVAWIAWLCINQQAADVAKPKGLRVIGAKIKGCLELEYATVEMPLIFSCCYFTDPLKLNQATIRGLSLMGSHVLGISANQVKIENHLDLSNQFKARGEVLLLEATIGGSLDCTGGRFSNPKGDALSADGADIEGGVFLADDFEAEGSVRLLGATIGLNFDCEKGHFFKPDGYALIADRINVKGSVFLRNEFTAEGEVKLLGATIGGNLDCEGGHFNNPEWSALIVDRANITGDVFLRNGFEAVGEVGLYGATIGGNLECQNSQFINPDEDPLIADRANHQKKYALNVYQATVEGNVSLRKGFKADGRVRLRSATINGYLELIGIADHEQMILDLRSAEIDTLWDDDTCWPGQNKLFLSGFVYKEIFEQAPHGGESRLRWLRLQPNVIIVPATDGEPQQIKNVFSPQPYEHLAQVLRKSGYDAEARRVLIGKERDRRRRGKLTRPGTFWNLLVDLIIAHGYRPHQALIPAAFFVVLGAFLFGISFPDLFSPAKAGPYLDPTKNTSQVENKEYHKFNALVYSLDVFIPIVNLHQQSYWLPDANKGDTAIAVLGLQSRRGGLLRIYLWLHISLGWILTTFWVAGLTGLVRKD